MTTHRRVIPVLLALALATGSSALAQSSQDVQGKIDRSSKLQQEALASLNDPARAEELVWTAHRELQAARSAMTIKASGAKFQDPLQDLNDQKAAEALALLQRAGDTLKINRQAPPPRAYLEDVRSSIQRAVRLTNLILVL